MEQVIEMDLLMESIMLIMFLMYVLFCIGAVSMTLLLTLDCCLPDPIENEFAFTDAYLSSLDEVTLLFIHRLKSLNLWRNMTVNIGIPDAFIFEFTCIQHLL